MTFIFDPANEQMNWASASGSSAHLAVVALRLLADDFTGLPNWDHRHFEPPSLGEVDRSVVPATLARGLRR